MGAAERLAIVEQETPVGYIQCGDRYRQILGDRLAQTQIKSGVPRQVRRHIARSIRESGTIVQIPARHHAIRKIEAKPGMQRLPLVMI